MYQDNNFNNSQPFLLVVFDLQNANYELPNSYITFKFK